MPGLRLKKPGFTNYTGAIGGHTFVDGVCEDMSNKDAELMCSMMACETMDGDNISVTQRLINMKGTGAEVKAARKTSQELGQEAVSSAEPMPTNRTKAPDSIDSDFENDFEAPPTARPLPRELPSTAEVKPQVQPGLTYDFTEESLGELISAEGMPGIRKFAASYGVKGVAIKGIVTDLMARKAEFEKGKSA